jgi:hypothetical protein
MLRDQELDDMLARSIELGKAVKPSQADLLEKQYTQIMHDLISIHEFYVHGVSDRHDEIIIMQECFKVISERFVK